ncbi:hypothetical protein BV394_01635 [Brevirhabdus pacifica]|uniref:Uncharacterized protein n=1 Tax=Brevirhabdus pacifica TaxID=1267768 RepID=A0A1U7DFD2_9RHOB|nr:hypothetical protein [Brevirhabdus pacifica]APX88588.1 hypothetical protein BV394_01635 [Brevirhabdus pacifica]OWU79874.1 hypothetical protein ATO5_02330 [Loktanella sp. 22II-4b]PJJ86922.1 hypothetical protein CLV77_1483 [Brevirhabdus pacifica]
MDWTLVKDNWPAFIEVITARWPRTTQNDLIGIDGDRAQFTRYLAEKHALTPTEAEEEIGLWLEGPIPVDVATDEHHDNQSITESGRHIPEGEDVYSDDREFGDDNVAEPPLGRD